MGKGEGKGRLYVRFFIKNADKKWSYIVIKGLKFISFTAKRRKKKRTPVCPFEEKIFIVIRRSLSFVS